MSNHDAHEVGPNGLSHYDIHEYEEPGKVGGLQWQQSQDVDEEFLILPTPDVHYYCNE